VGSNREYSKREYSKREYSKREYSKEIIFIIKYSKTYVSLMKTSSLKTWKDQL